MKNFFIAILAIVYLGVSSGVAMNIRYCMGKVASIDWMHSSDKCDKCGMQKGINACCTDEFKIVKINDSHKLAGSEINIFIPIAIVDNSKSIFNTDFFSSARSSSYNNNSPPQSSGTSLNILHCVFRI